MRRNHILTLALSLMIVTALMVSGVYATWKYLGYPAVSENEIASSTAPFRYSTLYITDVKILSGSYESASCAKTADVDISSQIKLNSDNGSSVVVEVTFYNNTEVSYYYNEAQSVSHDNNSIKYTVTGIEQKEELLSKTFKTIYVTYSYDSSSSNRNLNSSIQFSFVIDK